MNTHTAPGWWLVWMLYGVLLTIVVYAVLVHLRHRKTKKQEHEPCQHKRLRFHTTLQSRGWDRDWKIDPIRVAVCLDCGDTNVQVNLLNVHDEQQDQVLSEVMQARGYDQDPEDTTRWVKS